MRALAERCERALIASARRQGASRQQCRAAARRFVRRHRRDRSYLHWVLRSVGASSALAFALLGLGTQPAHAQATLFTSAPGLAFLEDAAYAAPALGDLDGDGDLDLIGTGFDFSLSDYQFSYFENTGDATTPVFIARAGDENPLDAYDVGDASAPALADLDADGDLDLVSGELEGGFRTYYLPEPGHGLLMGAGVALLSLLSRLRGRER